MAAVPVTIVGVETREDGTSSNVTIIGLASITGLSIGGGPIIPKPPEPPLGIWPGPGDPDYPGKPPVDPGLKPTHPIALPGDPWWPKPPITPPEMPPPGSPPVVLPGLKPVNPIVPPPAIVVDYPGVGKVLVPCPVVE